MRESSIVRVGKTRCNSVASLETRRCFLVDGVGNGGFVGLSFLGCFTATFFGNSATGPVCLGVVAG